MFTQVWPAKGERVLGCLVSHVSNRLCKEQLSLRTSVTNELWKSDRQYTGTLADVRVRNGFHFRLRTAARFVSSISEVCSNSSLRVARTTQVMARVAGAAGDDGGGGEATRDYTDGNKGRVSRSLPQALLSTARPRPAFEGNLLNLLLRLALFLSYA